jgi:hypothetical protein
MTRILWVPLALVLASLALWIVVGPWFPKNSFVIFLVAAYFGASALGGFWMLYIAVRYEKRPLQFALLSVIPYTFLWYYFERVRPGKHKTRVMAAAS